VAHLIPGFALMAAAVVNLLMAGLFWLVTKLPPDMNIGAQLEFGKVLAPVWRIVIASIVAEVVSELVDGEVYQVWVNRVGHRLQWMRVLTSNSVSVPLDSLAIAPPSFGAEFNVKVEAMTCSVPALYTAPPTPPPVVLPLNSEPAIVVVPKFASAPPDAVDALLDDSTQVLSASVLPAPTTTAPPFPSSSTVDVVA